jgi:hypothetical protein
MSNRVVARARAFLAPAFIALVGLALAAGQRWGGP